MVWTFSSKDAKIIKYQTYPGWWLKMKSLPGVSKNVSHEPGLKGGPESLVDKNKLEQALLALEDSISVIKGYMQLAIEKPEKNYNILIIKEIEKMEKTVDGLRIPLFTADQPDKEPRDIRVEVDSKEGEGARLRIYIPC